MPASGTNRLIQSRAIVGPLAGTPRPVPSSWTVSDAVRALKKLTYKQCLAACNGHPQKAANLKFAVDIAVKELRHVAIEALKRCIDQRTWTSQKR